MRKLRRLAGGRLLPCILLALFSLLAFSALSVWLPRLLAPIALAERLFALAVALVVAAAREPEEYKISKLILLIFLPWTGAALCLLWHGSLQNRAYVAEFSPFGEGVMRRAAALCGSCGLTPSFARSAEYFPVGREMYRRMLADLESAERFIWLEYYIVERGVFFADVLRILEEKSAAGVDVRLIYDDFGCSLTLPRNFAETLTKRGVRTCVFKKIRLPTRAAGRRDHRKIAVIDGKIAYTGGVNLADEYIGETIRFRHWKDTAIRLEGAPAARFAELFTRTWNATYPTNTIGFEGRDEHGELPCVVFADDADSSERVGKELLALIAGSAEKTLYLNTPYLAPDSRLFGTLKAAGRSGVDVRLMIPHIPDKRIPFALTKSYARELSAYGVEIREYTAGFLHAKSLVADGKYALVSTYNLDFRSLYLQAECGALVEDDAAAGALERDFLTAWKEGTPLRPARTAERWLGKLLRLFAPLI